MATSMRGLTQVRYWSLLVGTVIIGTWADVTCSSSRISVVRESMTWRRRGSIVTTVIVRVAYSRPCSEDSEPEFKP